MSVDEFVRKFNQWRRTNKLREFISLEIMTFHDDAKRISVRIVPIEDDRVCFTDSLGHGEIFDISILDLYKRL